jgi:hypothetical protein
MTVVLPAPILVLVAAAAVIAVLSAVAISLYLGLRSGVEICRTSVTSGRPWSMSATLDGPKVLTLSCDVDLEAAGALELCGPIRIRAGGRDLWQATFDLGWRGSTTAESSVRLKRFWVGGRNSLRGTARVAKVHAPSGSGTVTVEGTITAGSGVVLRKLELWLGGR